MNSNQNFRDVGATLIRLIPEQLYLPTGRIFRGGQIDFLSLSDLGSPATIINLRMLKDNETFSGVNYIHFPLSNNIEKYDTSNPVVRQWLIDIVMCFELGKVTYPVYIHCFAGKDRTGVVVAALLYILGVPASLIVKEYLETTSDNVDESNILFALKEFEKKGKDYFRGIKLDKVCKQIKNNC